VNYYSQWAAGGDGAAPRYRMIAGVGRVDDITQRVLGALK
jgi:adenylate kinase